MRYLLFILVFSALSVSLSAQDGRLYWKYKDYDGSYSFALPGSLMDFGSIFLKNKTERRLLRKVNKVKIMFFEGDSPLTDRDLKKFDRRAKRRHLDDMIAVRDGSSKTTVRVMAKERRGALHKAVVFVNTPEEFIMVSIKGKLKWNDIQQIIEQFDDKIKKKDKKEEPTIPPVLKVPVSRV